MHGVTTEGLESDGHGVGCGRAAAHRAPHARRFHRRRASSAAITKLCCSYFGIGRTWFSLIENNIWFAESYRYIPLG